MRPSALLHAALVASSAAQPGPPAQHARPSLHSHVDWICQTTGGEVCPPSPLPVNSTDIGHRRLSDGPAPQVIYGSDDRRDWYELDSNDAADAMALNLLENSVMAHIRTSDLGVCRPSSSSKIGSHARVSRR